MSTPNPTGGRDWTQVPVHPDAKIFPMMDADELRRLTADIRKNGQREAIVLYRGQVLDGRNRLEACAAAGIEPKVRELDESLGSINPVEYIISMNLARRHLSKSRAAALAAEHLPMFVAEAEVRKSNGQKTGGNTGGRGREQIASGKNLPQAISGIGKAVEKAAEVFGVSPELVRQAAKVKVASPEIHKQVKSGDLTVNAATQKLTACKKPGSKSEHVDGNGVLIPRNLQDAFRARRRFRAIGRQLGKLTADIVALAQDPVAGWFLAEQLNTIRTDLKNVQCAVKFCAPYQVCPYCKGKGCESTSLSKSPCRGTGWTIRGVKGPGA